MDKIIGHNIGKYLIKSEIATGGMSIIYLAYDSELSRPVAIKFLLSEQPHKSYLEQIFLQEATTLTALNHPHILTVYEIGHYQEHPYIVMEFIEGQTLRERILAGPLEVNDLLYIAVQIAEGLSVAHARGIIHRDIKPENIMIKPDNTIKILDFGLAKIDPQRFLTATSESLQSEQVSPLGDRIAGTICYMSPEQVRGEAVDERSDIFSLGVVIYEMLTGQQPFKGERVGDTIAAILENEPPPLDHWRSDLPADFEDLITKTLAKRKDQRYQNALSLIRALRLVETDEPSSVATTRSLEAPPQVKEIIAQALNKGFLGRVAELNQLEALIKQTQAGKGQSVFIVGEIGQGKTALVQEFQQRLHDDVAFFSGSFYENICGLPLVVFLESISEYLSNYNDSVGILGDLFQERTSQLETALRSKDIVRAAQLLLQLQGGVEQKSRGFEAIRRCFDFLAQHKPILFFLDNLQWADDSSLEALAYLVRTIQSTPILIMATIRSEDLIPESPIKVWLDQLTTINNCYTLTLAEFSQAEVYALLAELCPDIDEQPTLLTQLYQETGGNPYFVKELVMLHLEEGSLVQTAQGWEYHQIASALPKSLSAIIDIRLNRLNKLDLEVLSQAAVIGERFSLPILQLATNLAERELTPIIENACQERLIVNINSTDYRFSHISVQQILYQQLGSRRSQRLHERVAEALTAYYSQALEPFTAQLAYHYYSANLPEKTFEYAVLAAEQSRRAGTVDEQTKYIEWARDALAKIATDTLDNRKFLKILSLYHLGLGAVATIRGQLEIAQTHLYQAQTFSQRINDEPIQAAVRYSQAMKHLLATDYPAAQKDFTEAIASFERIGDHSQRLAALSGYAIAKSFETKELEQASRWLLAIAGSSSQVKGYAYTTLAVAHMQFGLLGQSIKNFDRAIQHLEKAGESLQQARTLSLLANVYVFRRQYDLAEQYCQRALTLGTNVNVFAQLVARSVMVPILLNRGEVEAARETAQNLFKQSSAMGNKLYISMSYLDLAIVEEFAGHYKEALGYYQQARERFQGIGYYFRLSETEARMSLCYWKDGQFAEALAEARQGRDLARTHQFRYSLAITTGVLGECLIKEQRIAEAKTYLREARKAIQDMAADLPIEVVPIFLADKQPILSLCEKYIGR